MRDVKRYDAMGCILTSRGRFVLYSDYDALLRHVEELEARLAECERDAERYRWLADQECGDVFMEHRPGDKVGLDLAIDAARAAQEDAK